MDIVWHTVILGLAVVGLVVVALGIYSSIQLIVEAVAEWLDGRRRRRVAGIEAELDRKQEELRRTILSLAEQVAAERDEVSREMTRAAFLSSGTTSRP